MKTHTLTSIRVSGHYPVRDPHEVGDAYPTMHEENGVSFLSEDRN